jgi:hypothetical protein
LTEKVMEIWGDAGVPRRTENRVRERWLIARSKREGFFLGLSGWNIFPKWNTKRSVPCRLLTRWQQSAQSRKERSAKPQVSRRRFHNFPNTLVRFLESVVKVKPSVLGMSL